MVYVIDQVSKMAVLKCLGYAEEKTVIEGFFKLVRWANTGAAWSMFHNNNELLAIVALVALLVLFLSRRRFYMQRKPGWIALGLMFGGIVGNLTDRLFRGHVLDFLYFYLKRHTEAGTGEIGFPAFNVADSAICVGVVLLFLLSFQKEPSEAPAAPANDGGEAGQENGSKD